MAQFVASAEKAGIPAVGLGFSDQLNFFNNCTLIAGVPTGRWVDVPRVGSGEERVATFLEQVLKTFTDPLTDKEKESGLYVPPPPTRIIFEGTLDDAQEFFQQTQPINNCRNCPIAKFTDGLPIIIPTEEKVTEMLTGTSHSPQEDVYRYSRSTTTGEITKATSPVTYAGGYKTTVEKVAVVAVMAGCKPEYLPVALAVATSGGGSTNCPGTSNHAGFLFCVSGPIAKEIGMNAGQNALDVGNPANMSIARAATLMTINFGQCITGAVRTDSGSPFRVCIAEDEDGLPPDWETLGETGGYARDYSVIGKVSAAEFTGIAEWGIKPSSFRSLIGDGTGGMARRMGVDGIPGPHNFLEYIAPMIYMHDIEWASTFVMHPNMAISLYDYGFEKKADVTQWLYDTFYVTIGEYKLLGDWDHLTDAGRRTIPGTNFLYGEVPDDYKLHAFGIRGPNAAIIVSIGFADEICWRFSGSPSLYPVDVWR